MAEAATALSHSVNVSEAAAYQDLTRLGHAILDNFFQGSRAFQEADKLLQNQLDRTQLLKQEQRFRLWAANLGLFSVGHASLDYRLRDADLVRAYITEVLREVHEYVFASEFLILTEFQQS